MSKFIPNEYTKGKWFIFAGEEGDYICSYDGESDIVFSILDPLKRDDALLMVHAPEMYEFLRAIVNQEINGNFIQEKARSILEKMDRRVSL